MWIIDIDHTTDNLSPSGTNSNAAGLMGPHNADRRDEPECIYHFIMFDDDDEACYTGRSTDYGEFDPLDDFGAPNAGCTYIKYLNEVTQVWEIL